LLTLPGFLAWDFPINGLSLAANWKNFPSPEFRQTCFSSASLFIAKKFVWHAPCKMRSSPMVGSPEGRLQMFTAADPRHIVVSLAGALLSAWLFVSAAVGPLTVA
jgi:hypothetical protein